MSERLNSGKNRRGSLAVLLCFLLLPLLALVALSIDYGFILFVKTDLQRTVDQAVLAAVRDLEPNSDGTQDLVKVKETIRHFVRRNLDEQFEILDSDIEIGRFDPATVYGSLDILDDGIFDTVRVTIRRDDLANASVSMYFARLFNTDQSAVTATATAVLQKAKLLSPGSDILPMSIPLDVWEAQGQNHSWSIYGDGKMQDQYGNSIPGNWGTLDVGSSSNSTADINDQILNGLRQSDLDALYANNRIPTNETIDSQQPMWLNGDTGLSSGIKQSISVSHGAKKLIPIYNQSSGWGGGLELHVVKWGVVEIVDSNWKGNKNTYVKIRKSFIYDGDLRPQSDLSNTTDVIDAAYTTPILVN